MASETPDIFETKPTVEVPPPRCCGCGKGAEDAVWLRLRRANGVFYNVCRDCYPAEKQKRKFATREKPKVPMSPELLAKRIESLRLARLTLKERKEAIKKHLLTDGAPIRHRHHQVMLHYLAGLEPAEIARCLGYSQSTTVITVLRRPEIAAAIRRVEEAQLERIISGQFGVQAQARALAPKAMQRVGTEIDEAPKPSDRIKASELTLRVAGELKDQSVTHHLVTIMQGFTTEELKEFTQHRRWPKRLQALADKLGVTEKPAIDVTPNGTRDAPA